MVIYKRLCLELGRDIVSCGGGAGVFWPAMPEDVKLEAGNMGMKVKAHMSGAMDILYYIII